MCFIQSKFYSCGHPGERFITRCSNSRCPKPPPHELPAANFAVTVPKCGNCCRETDYTYRDGEYVKLVDSPVTEPSLAASDTGSSTTASDSLGHFFAGLINNGNTKTSEPTTEQTTATAPRNSLPKALDAILCPNCRMIVDDLDDHSCHDEGVVCSCCGLELPMETALDHTCDETSQDGLAILETQTTLALRQLPFDIDFEDDWIIGSNVALPWSPISDEFSSYLADSESSSAAPESPLPKVPIRSRLRINTALANDGIVTPVPKPAPQKPAFAMPFAAMPFVAMPAVAIPPAFQKTVMKKDAPQAQASSVLTSADARNILEDWMHDSDPDYDTDPLDVEYGERAPEDPDDEDEYYEDVDFEEDEDFDEDVNLDIGNTHDETMEYYHADYWGYEEDTYLEDNPEDNPEDDSEDESEDYPEDEPEGSPKDDPEDEPEDDADDGFEEYFDA